MVTGWSDDRLPEQVPRGNLADERRWQQSPSADTATATDGDGYATGLGRPTASRSRSAVEGGAGIDIYVIGSDGSGLRQLVSIRGRSNTMPTWSPDGTRIAFVSDRARPGLGRHLRDEGERQRAEAAHVGRSLNGRTGAYAEQRIHRDTDAQAGADAGDSPISASGVVRRFSQSAALLIAAVVPTDGTPRQRCWTWRAGRGSSFPLLPLKRRGAKVRARLNASLQTRLLLGDRSGREERRAGSPLRLVSLFRSLEPIEVFGSNNSLHPRKPLGMVAHAGVERVVDPPDRDCTSEPARPTASCSGGTGCEPSCRNRH